MELLKSFFDLILHVDKYLLNIVYDYQNWTYLILFIIIFCETGLVVTPFLPGDSLLFAAGAIAGMGFLNIWILIGVLCLAFFAGDNTNYSIGRLLGKKVYERDYRLIKRKHLLRTHDFYEKHGGKTIVIARFIPIVRTFAPFVAGIAGMKYSRFIMLNILGGTFWVSICSFAGYFFGNITIVKNNFSLVVVTIIFISLLPVIFQFLKLKLKPVKQLAK